MRSAERAARRKREGIGCAGRREPDREASHQRIEPVGERDQGGWVGRGRLVFGPARRVVIADHVGDLGRFTLYEGVLAPHDPLQIGEFADHQRDQIALGQVGPLDAAWRTPSESDSACPSSPTRRSTRSDLASMCPSLFWNTIPASFSRL